MSYKVRRQELQINSGAMFIVADVHVQVVPPYFISVGFEVHSGGVWRTVWTNVGKEDEPWARPVSPSLIDWNVIAPRTPVMVSPDSSPSSDDELPPLVSSSDDEQPPRQPSSPQHLAALRNHMHQLRTNEWEFEGLAWRARRPGLDLAAFYALLAEPVARRAASGDL